MGRRRQGRRQTGGQWETRHRAAVAAPTTAETSDVARSRPGQGSCSHFSVEAQRVGGTRCNKAVSGQVDSADNGS